MSKVNNGLVGMYCLTFRDGGKVSHQGKIVGMVDSGIYIVQWFEWMMGEPTNLSIVAVESMFEWKFYSSQDDWHEAAERYMEHQRIERERAERANEQ